MKTIAVNRDHYHSGFLSLLLGLKWSLPGTCLKNGRVKGKQYLRLWFLNRHICIYFYIQWADLVCVMERGTLLEFLFQCHPTSKPPVKNPVSLVQQFKHHRFTLSNWKYCSQDFCRIWIDNEHSQGQQKSPSQSNAALVYCCFIKLSFNLLLIKIFLQ